MKRPVGETRTYPQLLDRRNHILNKLETQCELNYGRKIELRGINIEINKHEQKTSSASKKVLPQ